jgi:hypothetical protein
VQPRPHRTTWTFWSYLSVKTSTADRLGSVHPVQLLKHAAVGLRDPAHHQQTTTQETNSIQVVRASKKQIAPTHTHTNARANSRRRSAVGFGWPEGDPKVPSDHPLAIPAAPHAGSGGSRTYTRPNRCPHLLEPPPPVVAGRLDPCPASLRHRRPTKQPPQPPWSACQSARRLVDHTWRKSKSQLGE